MSDEVVELVFTDLPEPVSRRVPETMRRAIQSVADVLQGRRPRDVLVSGRL